MNSPSGPDERLLEDLREVLGHDTEPPSSVVQAAKESYTWRTVDAELAELTHDSLVDQPAVRTRAAAGGDRALTFEASDVVVVVEVGVVGQERRLVGQLAPAQPAQIEVRQAGAARRTQADAAGRFMVFGLAAGPVSLRCQVAGQDPVNTAWVVI
ncbi:MAG TPA: hypothetical protein VFM37_10120 [Pseudonocardiaceae bacterium]|nr:hypothetical protein [Pseudonocardiaceae bacterium]